MKKFFIKSNILIVIFLSSFLFYSCSDMFSDNKEYISAVKSINTSYGTLEDVLVKMFTSLTTKGYKLISKDDLKWEIEGSTNEGKIVVCKYKDVKVVIPTMKDGDYVRIFPSSIYYIKDGVIYDDEVISRKWMIDIVVREGTEEILKGLGPADEISTKPSKPYEGDKNTVNEEYLNKGAE